MDFDQCACSGKTLARLVQPAVMAVLAGGPLHGYLIVQRLGQLAAFRCQSPDPTGVYRVLKAMEQDGLVSAAWQLADTGPAKRAYALTDEGRRCLARWLQTLAEYHEAIGDLLQTVRKASGQRRPARPRTLHRGTSC
jgi:DNA-binding PadR family transcriptional regulator